ncbi:MAG: hypothetical protein ACRDHV_09790 [Actinomycetota bacterium]
MKELVGIGSASFGREPLSRRRRWVAVALAPAAALAVGVAAYALIPRQAEEIVNGIGCYADANREANTIVVSADGRDPVAVCAELWKRGAVAPGTTEAPPLVACAPPDGQAVWVFPGQEGTCEGLGLGGVPQGYRQAAARFVAMEDEMIRRFEAGTCIGEQRAREVAREVLDAHGFADWLVEEGFGIGGEGFSEARRCAGLAFDAVRKAVILVPEEAGNP